MVASEIRKWLEERSVPEKIDALKRYLKQPEDEFLAVSVPEIRKAAKAYASITLEESLPLIQSRVHEERLCALIIWVEKFRKEPTLRDQLHKNYLKFIRWVNNWDLVDTSAPTLVGLYLKDRPRKLLYELVDSSGLWQRRVAIVATHAYIKAGDFGDTLSLASLLLNDPEPLIHKAVGWSLREVGKKERQPLLSFLEKNAHKMARTALSYAIEHLSPEERAYYRSL